MLFVLAAGAATRGSRRWIDVGFFTFQPSEFGKVLFVLALAGFLAERSRSLAELRAPLALIGYGLAPILLVFLQPDIGTALVYTAALAAVLFVSGVRWPHLGVLGAARASSVALAVLWLLPAAGVNVLKPYQTARLTGLHASRQRPARRDLQPDAVDHRGRRRRPARPRRRSVRRRRGSTTSPSMRPTSRSPRSPRSAGSSAPRSCCCSTCSSSGAR